MVELRRILIVGGGIAGLSAAIALRESGFDPDLVEARTAWPIEGAAITMHANGIRALRRLGVAPEVDSEAAVLPKWTFHDRHDELLCQTDLTELWDGVGPCLGVTRIALQRLLLDRADAPRCRLGVRVTTLKQTPDSVSVGFSDGESQNYDLVVGADGIHSTVRRLAVSPVEAQYGDTMTWRSVADGRPDGLAHLHLLMGDGCFFGLVPVGGNQTYGFAGMGGGRFDDPLGGRLDRFRQRFASFSGPIPHYLAHLRRDEDLHSAPVRWVEIDRWYQGRAILVGDAAHATHPHMGEGGSMAVEDASVLAETLLDTDTLSGALEAYVARRRPRVDWVQRQSELASLAWTLPPAIRDDVLRERGDQMLRARYEPLRSEP